MKVSGERCHLQAPQMILMHPSSRASALLEREAILETASNLGT